MLNYFIPEMLPNNHIIPTNHDSKFYANRTSIHKLLRLLIFPLIVPYCTYHWCITLKIALCIQYSFAIIISTVLYGFMHNCLKFYVIGSLLVVELSIYPSDIALGLWLQNGTHIKRLRQLVTIHLKHIMISNLLNS